MDNNICRFIPAARNNDNISIINFVLETKPQVYTQLCSSSVYRMHLVAKGTAVFHLPGQSYHLQPGDLFFCMPGMSYRIESAEGCEYMYISYLGTRANAIMDMLHIHTRNCIFQGYGALLPLWQEVLTVSQSVSGLCAEGVLLYSYSVLGNDLLCAEENEKQSSEAVLLIKKYVDDHFSDPELTLQKVSQACSYNPKYISTIFKAKLGIGFSAYLNTIRIRHAYVLMEQGFTSVKNIAQLCGYKDPMYFSKVFRGVFGASPRVYMTKLEKK